MNKLQKIQICDRTLAVLGLAVVVSAIQLEITGSEGFIPVVIHMIVSLSFMCLIVRHVYLHFKWNAWIKKFSKLKLPTRILWWLYVLTFASGLLASIHWIINLNHSPLGGVHGKIGLLMILFALGHTEKRFRFMLPKP